MLATSINASSHASIAHGAWIADTLRGPPLPISCCFPCASTGTGRCDFSARLESSRAAWPNRSLEGYHCYRWAGRHLRIHLVWP